MSSGMTIHEAHHYLKNREVSSKELTQAHLNHISEIEPNLKAFVNVTSQLAVQQAETADQRLLSNDFTPLTGIPAQIKDNMCTKGVVTTCSSLMLEGFIPNYDATVISRLNSAGMVLLGKGNMDEFAMGSSTENSAFFPTRNPWDFNRVPGGSSGGPAAAVASGEAIYAIGSDTGGSIRQPAALCGIVGLKPTYGLVSRYGLVAFASSLDQIGPLTKDVTDCALVLNVIAGHDVRDSTSLARQVPDYTRALVNDIKGTRIGIPTEYYPEGIQQGVRDALIAVRKILENLGAAVEEISLPHTRYALACYYLIAPSEASANLARYDGVKYGFSYDKVSTMWEGLERTRQFGFGAEVKRRIMLGTFALSAGYYDAYYKKAQQVRDRIKSEFTEAFEKFDALLTPTSPTVAFSLGERLDDPFQMYLSDVCTIPANMAGIPAISVPCGFSQGLPVGMQLISKPLGEETLIRIAYAYEQATRWHYQRPPKPVMG